MAVAHNERLTAMSRFTATRRSDEDVKHAKINSPQTSGRTTAEPPQWTVCYYENQRELKPNTTEHSERIIISNIFSSVILVLSSAIAKNNCNCVLINCNNGVEWIHCEGNTCRISRTVHFCGRGFEYHFRHLNNNHRTIMSSSFLLF
jgi:hypothetical protein